MTNQKRLSLSIRSRMALREMTQTQLAELIDMGRTALSARLKGDREFTYSELEAIAAALHVSLRDLLPADDEEGGQR